MGEVPAFTQPPRSRTSSSPTPVEVSQELLHYGPHPRQTVQARWLEQSQLRPAVVLVHGGYWTRGGRWQVHDLATQLNAAGYSTFTPHYRYNTQAIWPAPRDDLRAAVEAIRRNAPRYHIDPDRIVVVGFSAGGQLALTQGLLGDDPQANGLAGVVAVSAPADPWQAWLDGATPDASGAARKVHTNAQVLAGCLPPLQVRAALTTGSTGNTCADAQWRDASAVNHLSPHDPPLLLIHSDEDFVDPAPIRALATVARRTGVNTQTLLLPGSLHGIDLMANSTVYQALLDFLARVAPMPVTEPGL